MSPRRSQDPWAAQVYPASVGRRIRRWGCMATMAIVVVIACVGWALSLFSGSQPIRISQPIPDDVPPAAGEPVPSIDINAPGRTSLQLADWATPIAADTGIPVQALQAYGNAALIAQNSWPQCHLSWTTLAGIGFEETRHGTYSGNRFGSSHLDDNGIATPTIIGVVLDGSPGFAQVKDTDHGAWDGDTEFDRAVGPMQFIPETFTRYGRDANGDGVIDPNQIDDAALTAAHLLCSDDRDLATPEGWTRAIYAYNQSEIYLTHVRDAAASYALRQSAG